MNHRINNPLAVDARTGDNQKSTLKQQSNNKTKGSADSAAIVDWSTIKNRNIIIWRDNDEAGLRYAKSVTKQLMALNCNVSWVDLTKLILPEGGDCVDWLKDHAAVFEVLPLIDPTPLMEQKKDFEYSMRKNREEWENLRQKQEKDNRDLSQRMNVARVRVNSDHAQAQKLLKEAENIKQISQEKVTAMEVQVRHLQAKLHGDRERAKRLAKKNISS